MSAIDSICVLGLGYIGLPTAAMFATHGFNVTGVDTNQDVLSTLNYGDICLRHPRTRPQDAVAGLISVIF